MTRRDFFLKWLFYSCLTLLLIAVQHLLLNHLEVQGIHPFILPLLAVMPAIWESRQESLFFAVALGLLCDLTADAPIPIFYTLVFLAAALLTSLIARRLIMPGFLCAFLCGALAMFLNDLFYLLLLTFSQGSSAAAALLLMGQEFLLSIPLAPLISPFYRKIYRRIRNE